MDEQSILAKLPRQHPNLLLGIGDDCAIFRPSADEDLVFTTDLFLEGVHFERTQAPDRAGRRALVRSLSDIAAMGAMPRFCLVSLVIPEWADETWIAAFYDGLLQLANETNTALAGGDLSHGAQFTADVMVCGAVPKGKALRRDGGRPGDAIYVSGELGGWRHRADPKPRLDFGQSLIGKATACIDISDGLSMDLRRLCLASNVSAVLDGIPMLPGATFSEAVHDGEDYELLFTAPEGLQLGFRIGTIREGNPGAVFFEGSRLEPKGYDHFRHRT